MQCRRCTKEVEVGKSCCRPCLDLISKRYHEQPDLKLSNMLKNCRQRAARHGVLFDLTAEWLRPRMVRCAVTNIPFVFEKADTFINPFGPSVDRIKAGGDYSQANCRVVLSAVNTALNNWGESVFKTISSAFLARAA